MNLSKLRSIHSALVTLQREAYKVAPDVRLQAARAAALIAPQIDQLDAAGLKLKNDASAAAHTAALAHQAEIEKIRETLASDLAALSAAEAEAVEIPKLPAAEFAKPDTPAELLEVIQPLFAYLSE